jgi:hypothetical protein
MRFMLSHECPHLRIEIWGTPGQIWATRRLRTLVNLPEQRFVFLRKWYLEFH